MSFFSKLIDIFSPIDAIQIDFVNDQFLMTASRKGKPIPSQRLASHPLLGRYITEQTCSDEFTLLFSCVAARLLYDDAARGILVNSKPKIVFSDAAAQIQFKELRNEWTIHYIFDPKTGMMHRTLPTNIIELASGYFFLDDTIWFISDPQIAHMSSIQSVESVDILSFAKLGDGVCLRCSLRLLEHSLVDCVSVQAISTDKLIITWVPSVPPSACIRVKGLTGYVVYDNMLYKELPVDIRSTIFSASNSMTLAGTEIPAFAQKYQDFISEFGDQDAKSAFDFHNLLPEFCALKFVLQCKCDMKDGVGKAVSIPVLLFDGQMFPAKEVSDNITDGYSPLGKKWISGKTLLKLGIGPLGRLADGTPLEPISLTPDEILHRGSSRLNGPWSHMLFNASLWVESGTPTDLFETHLEFLCTHGISGGVHVPGTAIADVFCETIRKIQSALGSTGKALIIMRKEFYEYCKQAGGLENVSIYLGSKNDPQLPNKFRGVVLCLYNQLDKFPPILTARWDILFLAGPDDVFKTNRSVSFANTKKIFARIRLGSFSRGFETYSAQQQAAITELFRYEGLRDQSLWRYLIRDISRPLPLPKPHMFAPQPVVSREKPVAIELSGVQARGVAIPERHTLKSDYGSLQITISSSFESRGGAFRTHAQQFVLRSVNRAVFVPFMSYWPTYSSMTAAQQQWYFYWRTQVRMGNYPSTDLSYIFVYIYEIINDVGYNSVDDGFSMLVTLWKIYREAFPKLDNYLPDWILDFAVLHKLTNRILEIASVGALPYGSVANVLIQQQYVDQNRPFDLTAANRIASYRIERSKFYLDGYGPLIEEITSEVLRRLDAAMRERFQKNLIQMFYPSTTAEEKRTCYARAVYDGSASYTLKYPDFLAHEPLSDFIDAVLRYTENRLREQTGYTGRLRGIVLDEIWKNFIDDMFGASKAADAAPEPAPQRKKKISLDANTLSQLRSDSVDIRARLIGDLEQTREPEKELLTDLRQILALLRECNTVQRHLLLTLYQNGCGCEESVLSKVLPDDEPSALLEEINRIALRKVSVRVLTVEAGQYLIEDDFRDEFDYIYNTPELMKDLDEQQANAIPVAGLNPLASFLESLDDFHLEILRLLAIESAGRQTLDEIANLHGAMTDFILDEINEAFQNDYDDLLLDVSTDPPTVVEEYHGTVHQYFYEVIQT